MRLLDCIKKVPTLFLLCSVCFTGCDKCGGGTTEKALEDLPSSFVMAKVGGATVTAGDVWRRLSIETNIIAATANAKHQAASAKRLIGHIEKRRPVVFSELIAQCLIDDYIAANSLVQDEGTVSERLGKLRKKLKFSRDDRELSKLLGCDLEYLKAQLTVPDRIRLAREHFDPACTAVSEKEIDEGRARQEAYKKVAAASNIVVYATCSNILARIRKGEDFVTVGHTYMGKDAYAVEEWDTLTADEMDNPKFRSWALDAPIGSVGGPFEIDGVLSVVKILSRRIEEPEEDGRKAEPFVTMARIGFPVIDEEPEPFTRMYVRKALLDWKANCAQSNLFEKLYREIKIAYPHGTNFVFKGNNKGEVK